ncbi:ribosome biogenesis protein SLX9-domain-containing protein [Irpex rosettiformis]|uniref:Ribosome biogenesis protein SLX9-domain-containing protein n=1 Tax=Irpex rosettiformis TaxID=378272 RepID=A0ACB8UKY7_9APHY|nr:ribosome biogenesis protein SLX9-domain-containing protein [Irpex rosettiformis]
MPKQSRRRSSGHAQSVRLSKHKGEAQLVDSIETVSAVEDIQEQSIKSGPGSANPPEDDTRRPMKKKDKQALKHELFLHRLEKSCSPYSKSHERRLKRKVREQVAGGLQDITAALAEVETDIPPAIQQTISANGDDTILDNVGRKSKATPGFIGEGKHAPLSKSQRKKALQAERMRIPLILSTPEFSSNPFRTIRTHAQNTLIKHERDNEQS